MKGKFSSIWRLSLALVMVLSLSLVMAAPVSAAVSQPEVTVAPKTPATAAIYTIKFTTNEDLASGDAINIEFPTGTTGLDAIATNDKVDVTPGTFTEVVTDVGQRLSITLDGDLAAGDITVVVGDDTHKVTNPGDGDYILKVYTSKEPTAVTSATYMISKELTGVGAPTLTPYTVATAATYEITFTTSSILRASDAIVVEFPVDTDISAVVKADVTVDDLDGADPAVDSISIVGQVLTITLGGDLAAGATEVTIANHIINPTTVLNPDPVEGDSPTEWRLTVYTSYKDRIPTLTLVYTLTAATATDIAKLVIKDVDSYISNDTASTVMKVQTQDQYGNPTNVGESTTITLSATPSGGIFSVPSVTIANNESLSETFTFKSATAGTYTITAHKSSPATPTWTDGTAQVLVNPKLELWGGGELKASYKTFTDAIAAALPYDTIKVAASTYDGGITINKPYLTIESTAGAASTTITRTGVTPITITATDVTIGGNGKGFTIEGKDLPGANGVILLADGATVEGNTIITSYFGVLTEQKKDLSIKNNTFLSFATVTTDETTGIFFGTNVKDSVIEGNTFPAGDGITTRYVDAGINTPAVLESANDISLTIHNNIFTGQHGLRVYEGEYKGAGAIEFMGTLSGSVVVSGNTIQDANDGIWFSSDSIVEDAVTVTIKQNTITGNVWGIESKAEGEQTNTSSTGAIKLRYNDIYNNSEYGLLQVEGDSSNDDIAPDARYNYWGSPTGPLHTDNPGGQDVVDYESTTANYSLWLSTGQATVVASGKSQYATSVKLDKVATLSDSTYSGGWNTFSTPIYLDSSANTWGELVALVNLQYVTAYGWDGTYWTSVGNDTAITPLNAVFVQLKPGNAQSLPILFSTQLLPASTKTMHATADAYTGWELIGLANMQPMPVNMALNSLGAAGTAVMKYSQVIDPISGVALDVLGEPSDNMEPFKGYWVFMMADGTLAGFTVTPVPFVPVP